MALYKKGAVSVPSNYRGVYLTNILAKIVERAIASVLVPYFDRVGSFGRDQWAFRKKTFMSRFDCLTNLQVALGP